MRILIACEFSGRVRDALIRKGHEAWSCDLLPGEGYYMGAHYQCGVEWCLKTQAWDMMIAFPPCTHLAVSGARWFKDKKAEQAEAIEFFLMLAASSVPRIAIENPIGIMSTHYRKPDQIIQPWQYGHGETKSTCLWLKNLPKLQPTNIVEGRVGRVWREPPGPDRWKKRSITYQGVADAMAEQWSNPEVPALDELHHPQYANISSLASNHPCAPLLPLPSDGHAPVSTSGCQTHV